MEFLKVLGEVVKYARLAAPFIPMVGQVFPVVDKFGKVLVAAILQAEAEIPEKGSGEKKGRYAAEILASEIPTILDALQRTVGKREMTPEEVKCFLEGVDMVKDGYVRMMSVTGVLSAVKEGRQSNPVPFPQREEFREEFGKELQRF